MAVAQKLAADFPAVLDYRSDLARSQNNLGLLLADLGKRSEAEAAHRAALALRERLASDHPDVPSYRDDLVSTLLDLSHIWVADGKVADAVAAIDRVAGGTVPPADRLYGCACVLALAAATADNPAAGDHAARAVNLLRRAFAGGLRDLPHMLKDTDLDPLRAAPTTPPCYGTWPTGRSSKALPARPPARIPSVAAVYCRDRPAPLRMPAMSDDARIHYVCPDGHRWDSAVDAPTLDAGGVTCPTTAHPASPRTTATPSPKTPATCRRPSTPGRCPRSTGYEIVRRARPRRHGRRLQGPAAGARTAWSP